MFDLDLTCPINLQRAEALLRRLAPDHPKRSDVEEKIRILKSGHRGEETLHYYLSLLPPEKYHIFHGLRLPIGKTYFQIDALLLSPKLIILLESKNLSGKLTVDKLQLTQEINDTKKIYQNPVAQTNRHAILLKYFFEKNKISIPPIENRVVFTKSSAEVIIAPGYTEAERKVCKAEDLLHKLFEIEKYYKKEYLDQSAIKKIKHLLLRNHTPLNSPIEQMFGITPSEVIPGVQCNNCLYLPMTYHWKSWICPQCDTTSKDAYIQGIRDYFLLNKPSINNSELCTFLQLPSPRVANYLFSLSNFPHSGINKGRKYLPLW